MLGPADQPKRRWWPSAGAGGSPCCSLSWASWSSWWRLRARRPVRPAGLARRGPQRPRFPRRRDLRGAGGPHRLRAVPHRRRRRRGRRVRHGQAEPRQVGLADQRRLPVDQRTPAWPTRRTAAHPPSWVAVDYCASGVITTERDGDDRTVTFDMGELFVCDTTLEHTAGNDAAFQQDDTPRTSTATSSASWRASTAAAAPPCPADQLEQFRTGTSPPTSPSSSWTSWASRRRHRRRGTHPGRQRRGHPGRAGRAPDQLPGATGPREPGPTYEALSIQYLSGDGTAVEDSCYRDPGATELDDINDVALPN